mmetsp:Transcript_62871/g.112119  ORF Transcript_62871/g.112119 Transcript_62871/m.112119 type:complete len:204 (-) Transcript_62871:170-781(-)
MYSRSVSASVSSASGSLMTAASRMRRLSSSKSIRSSANITSSRFRVAEVAATPPATSVRTSSSLSLIGASGGHTPELRAPWDSAICIGRSSVASGEEEGEEGFNVAISSPTSSSVPRTQARGLREGSASSGGISYGGGSRCSHSCWETSTTGRLPTGPMTALRVGRSWPAARGCGGAPGCLPVQAWSGCSRGGPTVGAWWGGM